jgi:hypothetical protein
VLPRLVTLGLIAVEERPGRSPIFTLLAIPEAAAPAPLPLPEGEAPPAPVSVEEPGVSRACEEQDLRTKKEKELDLGSGVVGVEEGKSEETKSSPIPAHHASAPDGTPPWKPVPVEPATMDRPDEFLATLGFLPGEGDYEQLLAVAVAELKAEGTNPDHAITPVKQVRMIEVLLRDGVIPTCSTVCCEEGSRHGA